MIITDDDIRDLIRLPKVIVERRPATGYREEHGSRRCDLSLRSSDKTTQNFTVFIRQHIRIDQNFSIGLRYALGLGPIGTITLVRYNGPHGETSRAPDGHYARPHIHYITAHELAKGHSLPQEGRRELRTNYSNFSEALREFFSETAVENPRPFFHTLWNPRLFNGH